MMMREYLDLIFVYILMNFSELIANDSNEKSTDILFLNSSKFFKIILNFRQPLEFLLFC